MSEPKIRVLVIQLARLGDTLQSLMALRAAQQLYPQLEITFLARDRFADATKRVPWLHEVITLPTEALLSPILTRHQSEAQGIRDIAKWVRPLVQSTWDFVINWSYSESSSYLTGLLPARVKLGYSRRSDGTLSSADGWSHYIQAIVQGSIHQNIHLTDILTTQLLTALQIHVGDPVDAGNSPVTSKAFFALEMGERDFGRSWRDLSRKWIGLQLGAGHETKTWSPESWARLATLILRNHPECNLVLLGGPGESGKAEAFYAELRRNRISTSGILSLVGQTDFDLWASVIGRCQWIVAGDTAASHLASVLGTRVLNLSLGPVRLEETGPYGNGHYVVTSSRKCDGCLNESRTLSSHRCREDVTPESVYQVWSYATSEWIRRGAQTLTEHFASSGLSQWESRLGSINVLRSRIRGTEEGGGVVYEHILPRSLTIEAWSAQVLGHIARAWYCGWTPPIAQEITRPMIGPQLIQSLRRLSESSQVLQKVCDEAQRSAQELHLKSNRLRSEKIMKLKDRQEIQELGKKLTDLDSLMDRLSSADPALKPFSQMAKVLMHNLKGTQLSELGKESAESYRQLGKGVSILQEWIKTTLELARPVALVPNTIERGIP